MTGIDELNLVENKNENKFFFKSNQSTQTHNQNLKSFNRLSSSTLSDQID